MICTACQGTGLRDWFRFNFFGIQIGIGMSGVCAFCHGTGEWCPPDRHEGQNWRRKRCLVCATILCRNDRFDAYFCSKCDAWKSPVCGEVCDVGLCTGRPEKPSMIEGEDV